MALWHRSLAVLMLLVLLCAGCNMMALPFFLLPGMDPKIEAKCKLASEDKNKTVRVIILASNGLETRPEFLRVDRELSQMLAQRLQEAFKKDKENIVVVRTSKVEKYKDEHPNWHSMATEEIGAYFNADYVINLDISHMSLYEPGSANTLFRGRAEISVDVVDVHKPSEGPLFREEYTVEYPKTQGPIPAGDGSSNPAKFRQQFLSIVAKQLSWYFTARLVEEDLKGD